MTDLGERRGIETDVYQPAEDSRLLLEAAIEDVESGDRVLDLGTGSGYVGTRIVEETDARVIGSDINPIACRRARERGLPVVQGNLVDHFRAHTFDVVVFNPPYLPANEMAQRNDLMEIALTGGDDGRAVIEPFIDSVPRVLTPRGTVFLLASTLTGLDAIRTRARTVGLAVSEVSRESFPFEQLVVFRMTIQ
jgi:release factor glutamine methyltransferase